ncbi:ATP-binding cassette domain-containing protein [Propionivibrio limicola]|uniref:ATP-binding cassette domain-containing protein n=1 Tax=Propionivibrio limicola TaxID=167645 RepID=UPI001291FE9D|nr:ATP-binding cassette domain-containing protein [Propionivibrio limicola]
MNDSSTTAPPWWQRPLTELLTAYPLLKMQLADFGIEPPPDGSVTLAAYMAQLPSDHFEHVGIGPEQLLHHIDRLLHPPVRHSPLKVECLTVIGGRNKTGEPENCELTLHPGSITSIVGPTGSGKSRLLADIEWMAQGDTPTGRRILINGAAPDPELRFALEHKLVAQLSQNMNFVMDLAAGDFIRMHAESRQIDSETIVDDIILQANRLAGESFSATTPVTALSGGQSRALMIADTAFLSASPVVLIDEVENAGIDRKKALQLLVRQEKIVLMATHDPILALMAEQRLIIRNGGIASILATSQEERDHLAELEAIDARVQQLRNQLRRGERVIPVQ